MFRCQGCGAYLNRESVCDGSHTIDEGGEPRECGPVDEVGSVYRDGESVGTHKERERILSIVNDLVCDLDLRSEIHSAVRLGTKTREILRRRREGVRP